MESSTTTPSCGWTEGTILTPGTKKILGDSNRRCRMTSASSAPPTPPPPHQPARCVSLPPAPRQASANPRQADPNNNASLSMSFRDFRDSGVPDDLFTAARCDPSSVLYLTLASDGLTSLNPRIRVMTSLRSLNLTCNDLRDLPDDLTSLTHLETLELSYNKLERVPGCLASLRGSLRNLSMASNRISSVPEELGGLASLETLNLSHNEVQGVPGELGNLSELKVLDLSRNPRLSNLPASFSGLQKLEELLLTETGVSVMPCCVYSLRSLRLLKADQCHLRSFEAPREGIANLQNLRKLDLTENELTELPGEIGRLGSLEIMIVSNNELTALPQDLSGLVSLKVLDAQNNRLSEFPKCVLSCKSLVTLGLCYNDIADVPQEVETLTNLETVLLAGNKIEGHLPRVRNVSFKWEDPDPPVPIVDGLFLGSYVTAQNKHLLKKQNVTHILTVAPHLRAVFPKDFTYKIVAVDDEDDAQLILHFEECIAFIDGALEHGGSVLVHCAAGISRSPSVVIAYLIARRQMTLGDALSLVTVMRPIVCPNSGFREQLATFEKKLASCKKGGTCRHQ